MSKCEEESWKDVAELVDSSGTFETESFKCKAVRKYAFFYGVPVESCNVQEVAASPQGLQGWAEMNVCIPGLNDGETSSGTSDSAATDPSSPEAGSPNKDGEAPAPKAKAKAKAKAKGKATPKPKAAGGGRTKKEASAEQAAEKAVKEILSNHQMATQIMEKVAGQGDDLPSEYRWAKSFIEEYKEMVTSFRDAMTPEQGQDITEFVDSVKLSILGKTGIRSLKKTYKDDYLSFMNLFVDRCQTIAAGNLIFTSAIFSHASFPPKKLSGSYVFCYFVAPSQDAWSGNTSPQDGTGDGRTRRTQEQEASHCLSL